MAGKKITKSVAIKKNASRHEAEPLVKHVHPDHSVHSKRLSRVKGQIDGIQNMIEERRYCPDIINQIKAARAALQSLEAEIFKTHLRACVKDAFSSRDAFQAETKVEEIMKIIF